MTDASAPAAAAPRSTVRALNCPNCGGTVDLRVAGTTVSVICQHCGSTLDATSPDLQVIARANEALKQPPIRLGSRGVLRGITWEAVGFMERTDNEVTWAEYLLFNPYEGYAFLVDDGQNFSFGRVIDHMPAREWDGGIEIDGMQIPASGDAYPVIVTFVVGEFYWRVAVGERVMATDYQRGTLSYSREEYRSERTWTRLDTLRPGEAEAAFGGGPQPKGGGGAPPAPGDPNRWRKWMIEAWVIALIAFVPMFILTALTLGTWKVGGAHASVVPGGPAQSVMIRPITLTRHDSYLTIDAEAADLDNGWVKIDYALIDHATQKRINASVIAEYYHGKDENGDWDQGDRRPSASFPDVPAGQYDLMVTLQAHRWGNGKPGTTAAEGSSPDNSASPSDTTSGNDSAPSAAAASIPVTINVVRGMEAFMIEPNFILFFAWPALLTFLHFRARRRYRGFAA